MILQGVKKQLRNQVEGIEKDNIQKHGFTHDTESSSKLDNLKKDISALNHYMYYRYIFTIPPRFSKNLEQYAGQFNC